MSEQRFQARVEPAGDRLVIGVPFDPDAVWGPKSRHHIRGTVAEHPIRGPLEHDGGRYVLVLAASWLRSADLRDAEVAVVLAPEGPQLDQLPDDVTEALRAEPEAEAFFAALATFYRKAYVRWLAGAKQPEKRRARIAEFVALLKAGQKQR